MLLNSVVLQLVVMKSSSNARFFGEMLKVTTESVSTAFPTAIRLQLFQLRSDCCSPSFGIDTDKSIRYGTDNAEVK